MTTLSIIKHKKGKFRHKLKTHLLLCHQLPKLCQQTAVPTSCASAIEKLMPTRVSNTNESLSTNSISSWKNVNNRMNLVYIFRSLGFLTGIT